MDRERGTYNPHALLRVDHLHCVEGDVADEVVVSSSHGANGDAMSSAAVALLEENVCARVDCDAVILVPDLGTSNDNIVAVVDVKGYVVSTSDFAPQCLTP